MEKQNPLDFTRRDNNTADDFADFADALTALQRVCGFSRNHNTIFLACIAAAHEHGSNEFHAAYAELGLRMSNEVQPYKANMNEAEQYKRRRALEAKFKRAYKNLEADQKAIGLWFVTVQSGGWNQGRKFKSLFQVNLDAITQTIKIARQRKDFAQYRLRCFEFAAEQVRDSMPRRYVEGTKTPYLRGSDKDETTSTKIQRFESMVRAYAKKIYECAVREGFSAEELTGLKEHLQKRIGYWFTVLFPATFEAEKVHDSDPHTSNSIRGTDACSFGTATQDEISTPPVIPNGSESEPIESDSGGDGATLTDALTALDLVRSVGAWRSNVILLDDATKGSEVLAKEATLDEVKERFPAWLDRSEDEHKSLVTNGASSQTELSD